MERGLLAEPDCDGIASAVDHLGARPKVSDVPAARILAALRQDKKARDGKVPFVLPTAIGRVVIEPDVQTAEIRRALKVMASREARQA
jgi:3-dehydroquinate synthase